MRGVKYISITGEVATSPITAEQIRNRFEKLSPDDQKILRDDPDYQRYQQELANNPDYRPVRALSFAAACKLGLAKRVKDGETELDRQLAVAPTFEEHQAHVTGLINGSFPNAIVRQKTMLDIIIEAET